MLPIRTILYPTDFSETAECAFPLACALARDYGARLIVLHVYPPPLGHDQVLALRDPEEYEKQFWAALNSLKTDDPNVAIEYELAEGDAASEILCVAQNSRCDLIVMGTVGRTGVPRFFMGSVAEQVVREAACPVLTVKFPAAVAELPPPSERETASR
jgi:nucleotide-binding universal stress UspA family protein